MRFRRLARIVNLVVSYPIGVHKHVRFDHVVVIILVLIVHGVL